MKENYAVENALGTIGAVLWMIQNIPQVIKSYREKSTKGLSASLMLWVKHVFPFFFPFFFLGKLNWPRKKKAYGHWGLWFTVLTLLLKTFLFHYKSSHKFSQRSLPFLGVNVCIMAKATRSNPCGQYSSSFVVFSRGSRSVVCMHSGWGLPINPLV